MYITIGSQFCCWIYFQPSDKHSKGSFGKLFWWHIPFKFFHFPFKSFPALFFGLFHSFRSIPFVSVNIICFPCKSFPVPFRFFHLFHIKLFFLSWFFSHSLIFLVKSFPACPLKTHSFSPVRSFYVLFFSVSFQILSGSFQIPSILPWCPFSYFWFKLLLNVKGLLSVLPVDFFQ